VIQGGDNVTVTGIGTENSPYIINSEGGCGGGGIESIVGDYGIGVDSTDPANPVVYMSPYILVLPPGSDAGDVPPGTPVGTIVLIQEAP
jgi:hypothetical protein